MKWLIVLSLLSQTLAAPTLPSLPGPRQGATFQDVLDDVWQNTLKAGYSKAAVIQFLGDTSVNAAVESLRVGISKIVIISKSKKLPGTQKNLNRKNECSPGRPQ